MNKELTTEERLENAIENQPERYFAVRNGKGKLIKVQDADTGRLWIKIANKGWGWID